MRKDDWPPSLEMTIARRYWLWLRLMRLSGLWILDFGSETVAHQSQAVALRCCSRGSTTVTEFGLSLGLNYVAVVAVFRC